MRIVCPACAAAYEVPDGRLLPGRVVRCARCDTDWAPLDDLDPAPPEPPAAPEFVDPPPEIPVLIAPSAGPVSAPIAVTDGWLTTSARPKRVSALRASWALSAMVLLAGLYGAYAGRDSVMHAWPPSIRAYAALGLAARH